MKKQNGITLIALIITIIVMMILVGVTVATAINGGLFETARKAARDTQIEADKEALLGAVLEALDTKTGTLDVDNITNLPEGWRNNQDGTYTSPNGNTFKVGETGEVELDEESTNPNPENPGGDTDADPVEPPEDEVDILAELKKYEGTSIMDFFAGGWDEANGYYKTNYENLENIGVYATEYGVGIVRAFNEDNTYVDYVAIVNGATIDTIFMQPEIETIQIEEGITAVTNIEDFVTLEGRTAEILYLDVTGTPQGSELKIYDSFTLGDNVNAILLSDDYSFSGVRLSNCDASFVYVPTNMTVEIKSDGQGVEFTGNANPGNYEVVEVNGANYYKVTL